MAKNARAIFWSQSSPGRTHAPTNLPRLQLKKCFVFFADFVLKFGFPAKPQHDQGREFENKLFYKLKEYCGIQGSHTTPYHPAGNGQVERFNRTLISMLRSLPEEVKSD
jgi:hypothetical protein